MCAPLAIAGASFALNAASAGASYIGQSEQAKAAGRFQSERYTETARNALDSYRFNIGQLQLRTEQEAAAASGDAIANARAGTAARGTAAAVAGASGVSGNSVQALLNEYSLIESEGAFNINRNLKYRTDQIGANLKGLEADTKSRIAGVAPQPIYGPSLLGLGLGVGAAGVNAATTYYTLTPRS